MIEGAIACALSAQAEDGLSGALALGGSMGTALAGAVFQALPYGLPKLIVSTMASGFTAPYVGRKDIAMLNAVTDISGINSISHEVYRNAAAAVAGMAAHYEPAARADKPLVLIGTLGTTEKCVRRIRETLEGDGFEVMVFHTSGSGGPTLDSIVEGRGRAGPGQGGVGQGRADDHRAGQYRFHHRRAAGGGGGAISGAALSCPQSG